MRFSRTLTWLIVGATLGFVACGADESTESGLTNPPVESAAPLTIPSQLERFGFTVIDVDSRPWSVAVADTRDLRAQGLMGVTDLGGLDGMLFEFSDDTTATFHMLDTLIPLDIAFFTADGELVSVGQMVPCEATPCEAYAADAPYRYALEAPQGALIELPSNVTLDWRTG
jgi:hypothetical protein